MAEPQPDAPRYLREGDAPKGGTTASVDVTDLLGKLGERTEELAEARVRQKHAEAEVKRKTREISAQRKAHGETVKRLEADCAELEAECNQAVAESQQLKTLLARERRARGAAEAELKRVQERVASLQHQLQIAWARLKEDESGAERRPWWGRLGS
jgi:chromosome segregation ATPase